MQILKSPFNWKNVSFHTHACLTFDHGKASDEIMRYFRRPTDRTEGGGGECRKKAYFAHRNALKHFRKKPCFSQLFQLAWYGDHLLPWKAGTLLADEKPTMEKEGRLIAWGRTQLQTQPATPSKPDNAPAPAESCPNLLPEIQNTRALPETSVKQTPYFLSTSSSLLPKSIL